MSNYEDIIRENAQKYYENGTQELSDDVFDALVDVVREENPQSEVVNTTGWGYSLPENGKIKHKYGIVDSLTKVKTWKEIVTKLKYDDSYKPGYFVDISAKIDGLSAILYYENNILKLALTRGKNGYGIDITEKVIHVLGTNKLNSSKEFTGAVRGELTMPVEEFKQYKQRHPEAKNSRNSTAGLINGDEITEDYKYIHFCAYSIVGDESLYVIKDSIPYERISCTRIWLENNFEYTAPHDIIGLNERNYNEVLKQYKEDWSKIWFTDGIVITNQDTFITSTNSVIQDSVAFKFQSDIAITEVLDIEWTMSKDSSAIPVLLVKPVSLAETTVKRVTAYNANYVQENCLGTGAIVAICKSGEIIPKVVEVVKPAEFPDLPITCGYCGQMFMWDKNHIHLYCNNDKCPQKEDEDIKAVCMNLAPIDGLGWKTIDKLLKHPYYNETFDCTVDRLLELKPFPGVVYGKGEQSSFNYMLDILQRGTFTISQFLNALNIPGLGKVSTKKWEDSDDAFELLDFVVNSKMEYNENYVKLLKIVQDKNVVFSLKTTYHNKIKKYFTLFGSRLEINKKIKDIITQQGTVCITGTLSMKRADFEQLLIKKGWTLVNTVKADTKFLITNTPESNTSKNKKADELGVAKITEKDFIDTYM